MLAEKGQSVKDDVKTRRFETSMCAFVQTFSVTKIKESFFEKSISWSQVNGDKKDSLEFAVYTYPEQVNRLVYDNEKCRREYHMHPLPGVKIVGKDILIPNANQFVAEASPWVPRNNRGELLPGAHIYHLIPVNGGYKLVDYGEVRKIEPITA